jgi:hypothetical protein
MIIDYGLVRWVQANYNILRRGLWPDPESEETVSKRQQLSYYASYENPGMLAGDIGGRTRLCGRDGLLAEKCYGMDGGVTHRPSDLARKYHMEFNEVINALNRVTWFCTDEEYSKGLVYDEWKKAAHGNRKMRIPATTGGGNTLTSK